MLNWKKNIITI